MVVITDHDLGYSAVVEAPAVRPRRVLHPGDSEPADGVLRGVRHRDRGAKTVVVSFGAEQFDDGSGKNATEAERKATYFSWYYGRTAWATWACSPRGRCWSGWRTRSAGGSRMASARRSSRWPSSASPRRRRPMEPVHGDPGQDSAAAGPDLAHVGRVLRRQLSCADHLAR
ncbi:hypothetical protein BS78_06G213400 [Paspalum vaginatum]|nr:hypothetical protein BS78_06G213400 [Paspalum vaginatum]